ncbi:carbamoyltransferase HypF [Actinomadura algeriensis]|uniref:Carbamoyltransferase n=1 Tax=Actinomadura algeriensis TaxID=1679523 RepID=A0ABR9JNN0_9ACTN|nr:carbamoyltransferase HypF [Actinomadura algeriensis]MBE1532179.1 hydrogenase maturation protein HypF [Actinomadura algeriensis]
MSVDGARERVRIRVEGTVQGVGFRPFVHELAGTYGLSGFVGNDASGVFAEAEGDASALARFVGDLGGRAPSLAVVERVVTESLPPLGDRGFRIVPSDAAAAPAALVSPDTATCGDCLAEIRDPDGRRHAYAFTNCTRCGPRFTIVRNVPYDRCNTTMAAFAMCDACAREYGDECDRRFHAQPVCCPACGPALRTAGADGRPAPGDPVETAARWLLDGRIVAVKGLGGYHLAALADHEDAVARLRARKHREHKPFAVMAPDPAGARALVDLDAAAAALLVSPARPIVLAARRHGARVAAAVAPGNRELGVLLPYTPLHHLLAGRLARPIVLTSGNVADEPIVTGDAEALRRLAGIADGFVLHDRRIETRADDSVVRSFRGRALPVRRSRGFVPAPLRTPWEFPRPVLACGAELKNTFCVARAHHAFLSHHIGDLENYETLRSYQEGIEHFCRLFGVRPEVVVHDLHPEYLSTKYALELGGVELIGVQHHHAHIASCLADNGTDGPVIGIAFDGLGYGDDGTLWGGELLVADLAGYRRAGHLEAVPMPGGAAAVREPWRMAAAYLTAAFGEHVPWLGVVRRNRERWANVARMALAGTNAPLTSSAGRLFDAVAAIAGVRDTAGYEGQAAIELQQAADPHERAAYRATVTGDVVIRGTDLVRAAVDDALAGRGAGTIAARFHNGLAWAAVRAARLLRDRTGLDTVALSGGVFQNVLLLERLVSGLEDSGFRVLTHSHVPPNDGGIALGQAVVAAARERSARDAAAS